MGYTELTKKLDAAGCRTFWFGPAAADQIAMLGSLLGVTLPKQFVDFLQELGGGGVEGAEISGIAGTADQAGFGTVLGDTRRLRKTFKLAPQLIVLRVDEEEYAWCLDCGPTAAGTVVGIALGTDSTPNPVAPDFAAYLDDYVASQIEIQKNS